MISAPIASATSACGRPTGFVPDLTVVLDISPEVGLSRVSDPDRLEAEPLEYHESVRQAYLAIAAQEPARYLVIDASGEVDSIAAAILDRVLAGVLPDGPADLGPAHRADERG